MAKYGCVLFDLDGTLLDTSGGVLKSIDYTIKEMGLPEISEDVKKTFIGPPIQNSFRKTYGLDDEKTAEAAALFRSVYKDKFLLDAVPYEGIYGLLEELRENGIKTAVATYKREDYTMKLLNTLDVSKYFDIIKGSDMEGKLTKADIVQFCIDGFKADKADIVLIGDSINDEAGAHDRGVDFIGVTFGFGYKTKDDIKKCVYAADSVEELRSYLLS